MALQLAWLGLGNMGTDALHQFFEAVFPGLYVAYSSRMCTGDYHKREEPLYVVDLARQDARHALDLADKSGATMRGLELVDLYMIKVKEHMGSRGDWLGSMARLVRNQGWGLKMFRKNKRQVSQLKVQGNTFILSMIETTRG
jgi:hypothetical protein